MTPLFDTITLSMIKRLTFSLTPDLFVCSLFFPGTLRCPGPYSRCGIRSGSLLFGQHSRIARLHDPRRRRFRHGRPLQPAFRAGGPLSALLRPSGLRILLPNGRGSGGANPARCDSTSGQPTYRRGGRGGPKYRIQGRPLRSQYVG